MSPGELLREARRRHHVTQRQLANRAGTTQSAISRIEHDQVSPTIATLEALLDLLGEDLVLAAQEIDYGHDRPMLRSNLELSPEERLERATSVARSVRDLQRAGRH
jgi:transcriptional regulator with XRE-family HTH domain